MLGAAFPIACLSLLGAAAVVACNADPVHTAAVQALGPEAAGIPEGQYHRAGQPCTVCHGGEGPASSTFTIAGTVFLGPGTQSPPIGVSGVTVYLEDDSQSQYSTTTNCVGNFWANSSQWNPQFPVLVTIAGQPQSTYLQDSMQSHVGRDPSCGGCHAYPASADSPGLIHLDSTDDPTYKGDPDCPVQPPTPANLVSP